MPIEAPHLSLHPALTTVHARAQLAMWQCSVVQRNTLYSVYCKCVKFSWRHIAYYMGLASARGYPIITVAAAVVFVKYNW